MNDRDFQLASTLSSELTIGAGSIIYLVSAKYTNMVRVNLVVLKAFLDTLKLRGIMITIDRPHQYISHLLQLHGIDQSNLSFIDAISSHASDTKPGRAAAEFEHGPFHVESLPTFLTLTDATNPVNADFSKAKFVLIDNVSTLLTYNTMDNLKMFFNRYVELARGRKWNPITTVLVMDKEVHAVLYEFVSGISAKIVDLTPEMTVKEISDGGAPEAAAQDQRTQEVSHDAALESPSNDKGVM